MVNRVNTAKAVHEKLCQAKQNSLLVIGRMRPLDRDSLAETWKPLKSGEPRSPDDERRFIVSTQCLEVGADLDFDVLISECAGMDALQQRFGRLDRIGEFRRARGVIVAASWQLTGKEGDPVYGDALRNTWHYLQSIAVDGMIQMGIDSRDGHLTATGQMRNLPADERAKLILQSENAPVLLPAHVDALAQTSPTPEPEPFIDYFLHGPSRGAPDVYVVWRSDIDAIPFENWAEVVALCPPSSSEAMPVPLWIFRKWFEGETARDESDMEVVSRVDDEDRDSWSRVPTLIWRGQDDAFMAKRARRFWPR